VSDRIAVLNTRLLACDTPRRLREERRAAMVVIEVEGDAAAWSAVAQQAVGGIVAADGSMLTLRVAGHDAVPDIVSALVTAGARVRRVEPRHPTLEDAYLALVRDDG
jgi:ABC-2 type transport system ATP-binding protein